MGLLDREKLLSKEKLDIEKVDLGGGDFVYVRQMTGAERDSFEQTLFREVRDPRGNVVDFERSLEHFRAKLAVHTICDEKGNNLLRPKDYEVLSTHMSARRLEKIVNVAQRLNAITEEDREALVKNSVGGPSGDSASDSAGN